MNKDENGNVSGSTPGGCTNFVGDFQTSLNICTEAAQNEARVPDDDSNGFVSRAGTGCMRSHPHYVHIIKDSRSCGANVRFICGG